MARPEDLDPVLEDLADRVREALERAGLPAADAEFERPRNPEHGDWATTAPLRLAKAAGRPPREIAQALVETLELPDAVAGAEVAGPGFVNFRLAPAYFTGLVRRILRDGPAYGRRKAPEPENVNVEFVSANPTGPLHVGAGRWAALGDAIAGLLEASGHTVRREYYVNDAGEQIRLLGESVVLAARGEPLSERHYRGDYVADLAEQITAARGAAFFDPTGYLSVAAMTAGDDGRAAEPVVDPALADEVGELAVARVLDHIGAVLHTMGVDFDVWFSERTLHESGSIDETVALLRDQGQTYERDGALFLRTTDFGDDKDRVLLRSDGRPTYFAADCAYMRDKRRRGADRLIYLLGADHHGYVARLRAVAGCLGIPADQVEIIIGQMVNLLRDGEPVRMAKRAGDFVALEDVLDEVGPDVTRYHFLRQSLDTTVDFDLARVVEQSMENPVYYVQYAHARIASLVRTADERGFDHGDPDDVDAAALTHPAEQELLRGLMDLPEVVAAAAELRATQRLARYAEDLSGSFHRFYTECRVLVDDVPVARSRYWLAVAAKRVLENVLELLRVDAPERM